MRLLELLRPYHMIVTRRVSEEEQVSFQVFHREKATALADLADVLAVFREHKRTWNQQGVLALKQQLTAIETGIEAKGEQSRALDEEIARKAADLEKLNRQYLKRSQQLDGPVAGRS